MPFMTADSDNMDELNKVQAEEADIVEESDDDDDDSLIEDDDDNDDDADLD